MLSINLYKKQTIFTVRFLNISDSEEFLSKDVNYPFPWKSSFVGLIFVQTGKNVVREKDYTGCNLSD